MGKKVLFILTFYLTLTMLNIIAQIEPNGYYLKHIWDFENEDAKDGVGDADGILYKDATISGGKLELLGTDTYAGYVELWADVIQINTFPELAAEVWATANAAEPNYMNMLIYFGTSQGTLGYDYFFYTPSRRWQENDPETRAGVSIGTWDREDGITYTSLDDEVLHHHVVTWKDSLIILYVDGDSVASAVLDSAEIKYYNIETTLSNDSAFIGKGGYAEDPTWKGTVELVALWDKALNANEIQWLYEAGEKRGPIEVSGINSADLQSVKIYSLNNRLFIQNVPDELTTISLTIYNILGSIVYQNNDFQNGTYLNLKEGVYVVKVESQENNFKQKVIIR
jgi:hypothetical protein